MVFQEDFFFFKAFFVYVFYTVVGGSQLDFYLIFISGC